MPKIPKYYVRPDGLHESILRVKMPDGTVKRKAFRGRTDKEVWDKIKAYTAESESFTNHITFDMATDKWWAEHSETVEYNTARGYKPSIERAKNAFEGMDVTTITPKDVDLFIRRIAKTAAKKTVSTQLQIVRQVFEWCELNGFIQYNPATSVKIPRGLPQKKREAIPPEEVELIKKSVNLDFGLYAYLLYYTGLRKEEALALKWEDIDRKHKTIRIERAVYFVGGRPNIKATKTESGTRTVPLLDALDKALPKHLPRGYIFCREDGSPLDSSKYERMYNKYRKQSGVTSTAHQIRHGYATALYDALVKNGSWDPKTAQAFLGHAQASTTMDTYTHLRQEMVDRATRIMNEDF